VILTKDTNIIRGILDKPGMDDFNDGERLTDKNIKNPDILYMLEDGCLFVAKKFKGAVNLHAAVPLDRRGKRAVKAARICINWLQKQGYMILLTIKEHMKHVRLFARAVGARHINTQMGFRVYRV